MPSKPPAFTPDLIFSPDRLWFMPSKPPALTPDLIFSPDLEVVFICSLLEIFQTFLFALTARTIPFLASAVPTTASSKTAGITKILESEPFGLMTRVAVPYDETTAGNMTSVRSVMTCSG